MTNLTIIPDTVFLPTISDKLTKLNETDNLTENMLGSLKTTTEKAYRSALKYFADFLASGIIKRGEKSKLNNFERDNYLQSFLNLSKQKAANVLNNYKRILLENNYAPSTINLRIIAVKSFVSYAFGAKACNFIFKKDDSENEKIKLLKVKTLKDTSGIKCDEMVAILKTMPKETPLQKRNYAILKLLFANGLRRSEVANLKYSDLNLSKTENQLRIKGKARDESEYISLGKETIKALQEWLSTRKNLTPDSPLFIALDFASSLKNVIQNEKKLTDKSIYRIVQKTGLNNNIIGLRPHKIRHTAITTVLDKTGGDLRKTQAFSRHKTVAPIQIYDDNRKNLQGEVTNLLDSL